MIRLLFAAGLLVGGLAMPCLAAAPDRIASVGESPFSAESDARGDHGMLIDLIHALDRVTHSRTKVVLRPFARSLKETAENLADFHLPLIQGENTPPPQGLLYVEEVDFGQVNFVIYSRKGKNLTAETVANGHNIETEPGHMAFFPFPVQITHCVPCSLNKVLYGRIDALIVPADVVDRLLRQPKYRGIHRALYKSYPVRALVPANRDSSKTRRYLIDGVTQLKKTGELWQITGHDHHYTDWQP